MEPSLHSLVDPGGATAPHPLSIWILSFYTLIFLKATVSELGTPQGLAPHTENPGSATAVGLHLY